VGRLGLQDKETAGHTAGWQAAGWRMSNDQVCLQEVHGVNDVPATHVSTDCCSLEAAAC
jgi:hypothetical protein